MDSIFACLKDEIALNVIVPVDEVASTKVSEEESKSHQTSSIRVSAFHTFIIIFWHTKLISFTYSLHERNNGCSLLSGTAHLSVLPVKVKSELWGVLSQAHMHIHLNADCGDK